MKKLALMMWTVVIITMTLLAGCGADGGGTSVSVSDVGNVEGTVTDATSGAVVSGATVQVGDKSATTNSSGVYSVTDLAVGSRTITATKTNYQNYTGTVTVTKGTTVTQNVQMTLTSASDSTPPTVLATVPADNITDVAINQAITVTFSEAMDCSTITTSSFTLKDNVNAAVGGTISSCNSATAAFTPSSNLFYSTTYTATINIGAKNAAGNAMTSDYSWTFTTAPPQLPSAPTGVIATAGDGQIAITWNAVTGATSYNIYWSTTSGVTKAMGTKISSASSPYTHTGRTNGTAYYYVVTAVNSNGESSESSQASATPQSAGATAPTTESAASITDTSATLSGSFINPSGYTTTVWFEYGTTTSYGASTPSAAYTQFSGSILSANITGLQQSTTYHFRLVTQNSSGTFYGSDQTFITFKTPTTLASGLSSPYGIAVDSTNVYWVEKGAGGTVKKVSINGGASTTLASGLSSPLGIAIDSTNVYWTEYVNGTVKKVSINGGVVTTLASGLSSPYGIVVDSTNVYWTEGTGLSSSAVKKVSINGGSVTTLASGLNGPHGIAIDSTNVYWTEYYGQAVNKVSINGGAVTTLASGLSYPEAIAIDSTNLYWTDTRGGGMSGGPVKKVGINGGVVTTLASAELNPYAIAIDSTNVYWTEAPQGAVKKVGKNGGTVTTLTSGQGVTNVSGQNLSYLHGIAIDSTSVYWTEYLGGAVKKLAK